MLYNYICIYKSISFEKNKIVKMGKLYIIDDIAVYRSIRSKTFCKYHLLYRITVGFV